MCFEISLFEFGHTSRLFTWDNKFKVQLALIWCTNSKPSLSFVRKKRSNLAPWPSHLHLPAKAHFFVGICVSSVNSFAPLGCIWDLAKVTKTTAIVTQQQYPLLPHLIWLLLWQPRASRTTLYLTKFTEAIATIINKICADLKWKANWMPLGLR